MAVVLHKIRASRCEDEKAWRKYSKSAATFVDTAFQPNMLIRWQTLTDKLACFQEINAVDDFKFCLVLDA
jgi:hypothetical protein